MVKILTKLSPDCNRKRLPFLLPIVYTEDEENDARNGHEYKKGVDFYESYDAHMVWRLSGGFELRRVIGCLHSTAAELFRRNVCVNGRQHVRDGGSVHVRDRFHTSNGKHGNGKYRFRYRNDRADIRACRYAGCGGTGEIPARQTV